MNFLSRVHHRRALEGGLGKPEEKMQKYKELIQHIDFLKSNLFFSHY